MRNKILPQKHYIGAQLENYDCDLEYTREHSFLLLLLIFFNRKRRQNLG